MHGEGHVLGASMAPMVLMGFCPAGEAEEEVESPELEEELPDRLRHQLRHRELFLSRQLESLPATHIRYLTSHLGDPTTAWGTPPSPWVPWPHLSYPTSGLPTTAHLTSLLFCRGKCSVTLLNETESLKSYLEREVRGHPPCHLSAQGGAL